MRRLLIAFAVLGWVLSAMAAASGAGRADEAELARIRLERQAVDARHAQEVAGCANEFTVTACLQRARDAHRAALEQLQRQQQVIDDSRRRERAAQRLLELERKANAADATARAVSPGPAPSGLAEPAKPRKASPAKAPASTAVAAVKPRPHRRSSDDGEAGRIAAQRASQAQARQLEAERHRLEVRQRNAEQDRRRPPGSPLPVPTQFPGTASAPR